MSLSTEHVYTLADLKNWSRHFPADYTALAVIGHPIAHSLSPVMHNAALAELAKTNPKFKKWRYFKFDIAPDELAEALHLFHKNGFPGLNLTVPHKALVVPYLDSKNTFVENAGAANTLIRTKTGWQGNNTDGIGLSAALYEELGTKLRDGHVILLGAGGAARAAATQCVLDNCASLWIGNRTPALRTKLAADLRKIRPSSATRIHRFSLRTLRGNLPRKSIVINATSLGLKPSDGAPIDLKAIFRPSKVYDMIYGQTALLRQASELGIPNANGLSMLVHQGAASLELWTGVSPPVEIMHKAVRGP